MFHFLDLEGNQWSEIINKARMFVELNDRALYLPYHEMIAAEISEMEGVYFLGLGSNGIREYWTEKNPFFVAQHLAKQLYENVNAPFIDKRLIEVRTNLRNWNVTLVVNSQRLYQFVRMMQPAGARILLPILVRGREAAPLPRAIAKCHALYRLEMAEQWPVLAAELQELLDQITSYSGGDDAIHDPSPCEFDTNPFLLESSYIGAGEGDEVDKWASESMIRIGTFSGRPTYLLPHAPTPSKGGRVVEHKLYIQSDFRLRKWTVYSPEGGAEYDTYNSTLFDLVPLDNDGRVMPIVQLRFALISLLMSTVIAARNPENGNNHSSLVRFITRLSKQAECPSPGTTFAGNYINESIDFMKMVKSENRIPPFYPAIQSANAERDSAKNTNESN